MGIEPTTSGLDLPSLVPCFPLLFPCFPLLGLTPSRLFMGLSSTIIYTSELILCSTICVPSATRHNIHMFLPSTLDVQSFYLTGTGERLIVKNYHETANHAAGINLILCQLSWKDGTSQLVRLWRHAQRQGYVLLSGPSPKQPWILQVLSIPFKGAKYLIRKGGCACLLVWSSAFRDTCSLGTRYWHVPKCLLSF